MTSHLLLEDTYLRAQWSAEFDAFESSPESAALLARLRNWAKREVLNERSSESAFITPFFVEAWGYRLQGDHAPTYTRYPRFKVAGAGQSGGTGEADAALGHFGTASPKFSANSKTSASASMPARP